MQKSKILCSGWAVFIFAFLLRMAVVFLTNSHISPEVWEYKTMAANFLDGRGFVYRDFGTLYHFSNELLYPAICAAVYLLTNYSYLAIEVVQAAASAYVAALIYNTSSRRFRLDNTSALAASMLVAVHPGILVYAVKLHPFVFDMLLMTGSFAAFLVLLENFSVRNALLSGFLTGLCFMTKLVISVFALAALGYIFSVHRPGLKRRFYSLRHGFSAPLW